MYSSSVEKCGSSSVFSSTSLTEKKMGTAQQETWRKEDALVAMVEVIAFHVNEMSNVADERKQ